MTAVVGQKLLECELEPVTTSPSGARCPIAVGSGGCRPGGAGAAPASETMGDFMRLTRLAALTTLALAVLAGPLAAGAQVGTVPRIGVLLYTSPSATRCRS
jgi:hypothetical protein